MSRKEIIENYIVNLGRGYIEVEGTPHQMTNFEDFSKFVETESYEKLYKEVITKLSRKRNFDFHVNDFFLSLGYDLSNIKIPELMNPFGKILFLKIMGDFEREVGNILLSEFKTYEEIMDFKDVFKMITDGYYDKGMLNFTHQQHRTSEIIKNNFEKNLEEFKRFLKIWKNKQPQTE